MTSQDRIARTAGFMYLFALITAVFSEFHIRGGLLEWADLGKTASNIAHSEALFRTAIVADLSSFAAIVVLAVSLYLVVKPVNPYLALIALCWWLGEAFILGMTTLNSFKILFVVSGAGYLAAFDPGQLHALVGLLVRAYYAGYDIALIFFSLGSSAFACLLFKGRLVPRLLAGFGVLASLLFLAGTVTLFLWPEAGPRIRQMINPPIALYELLVGLWLLIKGVRLTPYREAGAF
jgi:hypothetical protein